MGNDFINTFQSGFHKLHPTEMTLSKPRGSLIVLKRNLLLNILTKYGSEAGRVSYIKTIIAGHKFAFILIYAPSKYEPDFFSKLISVLTQIHDYSFIIGADMNACVNLTLDKSARLSTPTQIRSSKELQDFLSAFSLVDLYHVVNPTCRQYTFYSARHQSFSRLDCLLVSTNSFSEIHNVVILPCSLSDHSIVSACLTLRNTPSKASRWWFNISLLRNEEFCHFFCCTLKTFIEINAGSRGFKISVGCN